MKRTPQDRVDEHNKLAKALNAVEINRFMGNPMHERAPHDPSASRNLSGVQFRHFPGDTKGGTHHLVAKNSDGTTLGRMSWDGSSGRVSRIAVDEDFQGLGVATSLWDRAHKLAEMGHAPAPKHSNDRTLAGDAWAAKVGGKRPRLASGRKRQNEERKKMLES
jgi:GNAT superfamily N-acetyltransferase